MAYSIHAHLHSEHFQPDQDEIGSVRYSETFSEVKIKNNLWTKWGRMLTEGEHLVTWIQ